MKAALFLIALVAQDPPLEKAADAVAKLVDPDPTDFEPLFADGFLKQVPAKQLGTLLKWRFATTGRVTRVTSTSRESDSRGRFIFECEKGTRFFVTLGLDANGKISTFWLAPPAAACETFEDVVTELNKLPGTTNFRLAKLGEKPEVISELHPEEPLAIGSAFKLYILGALVKDKKPWDEKIALREDCRSLPSGTLHTKPLGTEYTVEQLAAEMISKSDNTATDHLLMHAGRERVEEMMKEMGNAAPEKSQPFLMTLEMFKIKTIPSLRTKWLEADVEERRAMLAGEVKGTPRTKVGMLSRPTAIDSLEWFASAADLVRAMDWLRRANEPTATKVLSINPGLDVPRDRFDFVGFKGGSEPGVLNLTFLLRSTKGDWYALSAGWNDAKKKLDEAHFTAIVQAAIYLVAK